MRSMKWDDFFREFVYTHKRMERIISHEVRIDGPQGWSDYKILQESARSDLPKFLDKINEVRSSLFGFRCIVPYELEECMTEFRERDAMYARHYDPPIDLLDPSIAR